MTNSRLLSRAMKMLPAVFFWTARGSPSCSKRQEPIITTDWRFSSTRIPEGSSTKMRTNGGLLPAHRSFSPP